MTADSPRGSRKIAPNRDEPAEGRDQPTYDHGNSVVKAALYAVASVATGIGTILVAAGSSAIEDGTVRYALTVLGVVAALAMAVVALYLHRWRR